MAQNPDVDLSAQNISLERDSFMLELLRHLSGTLQDVIGVDEAVGFISIVGQKMGDDINQEYCRTLGVDSLSRQQVAAVMADLKQRIKGDFRVISEDVEKIVLQTSSCPFGERVKGRPSLCMMTSNVFGTIAAENLGYAKVSLEQTIARGDAGCRVVVYLKHSDEAEAADGNEYYQG